MYWVWSYFIVKYVNRLKKVGRKRLKFWRQTKTSTPMFSNLLFFIQIFSFGLNLRPSTDQSLRFMAIFFTNKVFFLLPWCLHSYWKAPFIIAKSKLFLRHKIREKIFNEIFKKIKELFSNSSALKKRNFEFCEFEKYYLRMRVLIIFTTKIANHSGNIIHAVQCNHIS